MGLMDQLELEKAKCNRERVKQGYGNQFYAQQAAAIAQWQFGEPKPESVILGELPIIGQIRLDRED